MFVMHVIKKKRYYLMVVWSVRIVKAAGLVSSHPIYMTLEWSRDSFYSHSDPVKEEEKNCLDFPILE